jgi:hypothetical protein
MSDPTAKQMLEQMQQLIAAMGPRPTRLRIHPSWYAFMQSAIERVEQPPWALIGGLPVFLDDSVDRWCIDWSDGRIQCPAPPEKALDGG